ncbi:hypothetical protein [Albimonas pacifica]|uniref:Capsule polysaccharide biosynthesis protein n=1 Tax=Albimonas pacifica TaxID=1114924 RepID=A0A1I3IN11_9RHOB|nr:hypothetical protein [Albimonas pacifica]SFI49368.1 Capsule polysaccharide biosynthesis protein [Albimonas pacifica]
MARTPASGPRRAGGAHAGHDDHGGGGPRQGPSRARLRRALRTLTGGRGATRFVHWADAPAPGTALPWLLPAALPGHPPVALGLGEAPARSPEATAELAARIAADLTWWPAAISTAARPETLVDLRDADAADAESLLAMAEARAPAADTVVLAHGGEGEAAARRRGLPVVRRVAEVCPSRLDRVVASHGALAHRAAVGGRLGLTLAGEADPAPWLSRARFVDPWRGLAAPAAEALDALALLRAAAQRNDRRTVTLGFSRWKRRNADPFLTGPEGRPAHVGGLRNAVQVALATRARLAVWGMRDASEAEAAGVEVIRLEDGFVRSVGLGLRHAPPCSLAVDRLGLYFDATRPTDLEALMREAEIPEPLLERASALRRRLIELGITKYNLARSAPLPQTSRRKILVPGQVEGDQSLRFGSPEVQQNAELLRRVRARHPEAFILYKPHPDVLTGLRPGAVDEATLAACADAVATESAAEACLEWADRVECMTSLMGFEALLRDLPVTTFGRPFYAGWGLTETPFDPAFSRGRTLSIDALAACALILYPRYVDPVTRLPAPPEKVLEWLHAERDYVKTPRGRAREAWRGLASRALNLLR